MFIKLLQYRPLVMHWQCMFVLSMSILWCLCTTLSSDSSASMQVYKVTKLSDFCQLGYFWKLIVFLWKDEVTRKMATFWETFLHFTWKAVSLNSLLQVLKDFKNCLMKIFKTLKFSFDVDILGFLFGYCFGYFSKHWAIFI